MREIDERGMREVMSDALKFAMDETDHRQVELCKRYGAEPFPTPTNFKVGIAANVRDIAKDSSDFRQYSGGGNDTTGAAG